VPNKFHGEQLKNILRGLVDDWIPNGPPVAILEGFPGCGKSQVAKEVAEKAERAVGPVQPPEESGDSANDLFFELAMELELRGFSRLAQELDAGGRAHLNRAFLDILRHESVLVVIDEFQRLFPKNSTTPTQPWDRLVEQLNEYPKLRGRLLLVSNRAIKVERWCANCRTEQVRGLADEEAEALLSELLMSSGLEAQVPPARRREVAHRLGGNPRALKTLVSSLRTDSLDNLLSAAPDLSNSGDVMLDQRLIEDFERQLLERALPKLDADLLKFLRWLSVHRRPFQKEALAQFTGGSQQPDALRQQLIERFLLDHDRGWNTPHPLAREISVTRLRANKNEWLQAHRLAANYHLRPFKARELKGQATLGPSYVELRHHLYEAGRIDDLQEVSKRFVRYVLSRINLGTAVPKSKEGVQEHITLISALPTDERTRVLEYHLARCLQRRRGSGDLEQALEHARRATAFGMPHETWLLRIDLEYRVHGVGSAEVAWLEAVGNVNASPIYQRGAELLVRSNRIEDAIKLLEKGIQKIPPDRDLSSLYHSCAELMARANRLEDAIKLLAEGIEKVPAEKGRFPLYRLAADLADLAGRNKDAEKVIISGLAAYPPGTGEHYRIAENALRLASARRDSEAIYHLRERLTPREQALADFLLARLLGDWERAAEIAHQAYLTFGDDPSVIYDANIYEADALLALGQFARADDLLREYQVREESGRSTRVVWLKAYLSLHAGRIEEAKSLAAMFAPKDFDSERPLDEAELLRLWSVARNGMNAPLEASFPGLVEFQRRREGGAETGASVGDERRTLLVVATEWDSRHGGLSTFNRDLCGALAVAGAHVVCYVPRADQDEIEHAKSIGVEIAVAPKTPGTAENALLFQRPPMPVGFIPDVVIGHDRITGAASMALARDHYKGSKRVLFIHTSPEEIEWDKEPRNDSTSTERAATRKHEQLDLARNSALVVAVGPRLTAEFGTDLRGVETPPPLIELTPGLPFSPARVVTEPPASIRCLILGRAEDYTLKGLGLAARALGRVVADWRSGKPPKLIVRGAPLGSGDALRERLVKDSGTSELDVVVRHYAADEQEIRSDLLEASLVLMPSLKEGFGLVGLEAIACGVPTLISEKSGLAETLLRHVPEYATEWILPVTGNAETTWAERIKLLLCARERAFASAAVLRDQLVAKLDWQRGIGEIFSKLFVTRSSKIAGGTDRALVTAEIPPLSPSKASDLEEKGQIPNDSKARVFVSHSSQDKAFVRKLVDELNRHDLKVWFDEREIKVGDSIVEGISRGLRDSEYLMVVLSKSSVSSRWVREELNTTLTDQLSGKGGVVLPVLIEDCEIPPLLKGRLYADFRGDFDTAVDKLLDVLGQEGESTADFTEARPIKAAPRSTMLATIPLADLRRRMTKRMSRSEVAAIWYDVLGRKMEDDMANRPLVDCVIDLIEQAKSRSRLSSLIDGIYADRPDLADP
jgi:glycosyltransferase involved in cell wall biosynthesis/tetratricopeptide (TPR) repeat protein